MNQINITRADNKKYFDKKYKMNFQKKTVNKYFNRIKKIRSENYSIE